MFYYLIKFQLANEKKAEEIALDEHREKFNAAEEYFNSAGANARTYKKIIRQSITPSYVEIIFECASQITNPTMCFRNYSKYLIETFDLGDWVTASGNFLKGVESKELSENEVIENKGMQSDEAEEISDIEMVKEILDLCFANSVENAEEKKKRRRTIYKMKLLLREYQR